MGWISGGISAVDPDPGFSRLQKMLQSRCPLYLVNYLKYRNKAMSDRYREAYLFRVQYQTHRNMNQALKQIRVLRKAKKVQVSRSVILGKKIP